MATICRNEDSDDEGRNEKNDEALSQAANHGNTHSAVHEGNSSSDCGTAGIGDRVSALGASHAVDDKVAARLREAAHQYHVHGFNVVSVGGSKRPNIESWKPLTEARQLDSEIDDLPFGDAYGLALICGSVSGGHACLDYDGIAGEPAAFLSGQVRRLGLPDDYAWVVVTPSGGHIWFRPSDPSVLLGGRGKIIGHTEGCHHVELRFDGHYTVAPPSRRQDRGVYRFAAAEGIPREAPMVVVSELVASVADWSTPVTPELPGRPLGLLPGVGREVSPDYVRTALTDELARVGLASKGQRNNTLYQATLKIGSMLHLGLDRHEVTSEFLAAALKCGLKKHEAALTIASGMAKGSEAPRDLALRAEAAARAPLPAYPLHALPAPIRAYVLEAASCIGCPVDMVAVPLLGYAAATIGRSFRIQIKPGYEKHPVLWMVVVGAPGSGKSPADSAARRFIDGLQAQAQSKWALEHASWKVEHEAWAASHGRGRVKSPSGASAPVEFEPEEPVLEHFFTTDATIEAVAPMIAASVGLAVAHDEIVGWVKSMDAYSGASGRERSQHLSLWAERPLKVDRKGRMTIFVQIPVVSVVGGVQPDLLRDLAGEARKDDGFVDRFLWSFPETTPSAWSEDTVDEETAKKVTRIFSRLRRAEPAAEPVVLAHEAKAVWRRWYNANSAKIAAEHGQIAGIHAKADVQVARLALVLHVLEYEEPTDAPVSASTLQAAIALVEYHIGHAREVVSRLGSTANAGKKGRGSTLRQRVVAILDARVGWTLASEISAELGGHIEAEVRDAELSCMLEEGLVERRIKESGDKGGRPGTQWRLAASSGVKACHESAA